MKTLAEKIMEHAEENYTNGWDWIVECMEIDEITEECERFGITSVKQYGKEIVKPRNDHAADIRAEIF